MQKELKQAQITPNGEENKKIKAKEVDTDSLAKEMERIVSADYVSTSIFERVRNALDIYPYELEREKLPYIVVMPKSAKEISDIMRYANQHEIPVYPRGSGTSLHGASRYQHPGIIINTSRMRGFELFEDMFYFECEPGIVCNDLMNILEEKGYFLPFEPGSQLTARLGGLASNNTSAHIVDASIGKASDYIMGVEVVLPDGQIMETGTKGLRRIAGTDLTKFFVGGDGLLGIITKIRMRLIPLFKRAYGIAVFDNLPSIGRGVQRMYMERRPIPIYMEFMDYESAKIGYEIKGLGDPGGSVLFFRSIGHTSEEAQSKMESVLMSFKAEKPLTARVITDMDEQKKIWAARGVLGSFLMQSSQNKITSLELVTNLKDLVPCMEEAKAFNKNLPILSQFEVYLFGHIGSLSLHPTVIIPKDWDNETMEKVFKEKFQVEMELNLKYGTAGGEWGQFARRAEFFRRRWGDVGYEFMVNIKQAIDPKNILNRGVLEGY